MELRPYQNKSVDAVFAEWQTNAHTLLVLPTGGGKTIIFAAIASRIVAQGDRVLVLCHREELIRQAADKIAKSTGLSCAIEKAEESSVGCLEMITVGSVQSLLNRPGDQRLAQQRADILARKAFTAAPRRN